MLTLEEVVSKIACTNTRDELHEVVAELDILFNDNTEEHDGNYYKEIVQSISCQRKLIMSKEIQQ